MVDLERSLISHTYHLCQYMFPSLTITRFLLMSPIIIATKGSHWQQHNWLFSSLHVLHLLVHNGLLCYIRGGVGFLLTINSRILDMFSFYQFVENLVMCSIVLTSLDFDIDSFCVVNQQHSSNDTCIAIIVNWCLLPVE